MSVIMAATLENLEECPHCGATQPAMVAASNFFGVNILVGVHDTGRMQHWRSYQCQNCRNLVLAASIDVQKSQAKRLTTHAVYPAVPEISEHIPEPASRYLRDAQRSLHAPTASILSSASAIDAMLKAKGYKRRDEAAKERSLAARIKLAREDNVLADGMAEWADAVRLDGNAERHADDAEDEANIPGDEELRERAANTLELAKALGEFLFVLPARVARGKQKEAERTSGEDGTAGDIK